MIKRSAIGCVLLTFLFACAHPEVIRDGVSIPYESAAQRDILQAHELLDASKPNEAIEILDRFLVELPASRRTGEALFMLGQARSQLGQMDRAVITWRRLIDHYPRDPHTPEARFRLAKHYRDRGRIGIASRVLSEAQFGRADDELRRRMYRMLADLARIEARYADSVRALAFARRDTEDRDEIFEIDLELDELIGDRLRDAELEELVDHLPRGPVYDRVLLETSRRALMRADFSAAMDALDRLPQRLQPLDEAERQRLWVQAQRGAEQMVYTIGLALPLSGPYAHFGHAALQGVVLGLGLYDEPPTSYRVVIRDTEGDPDTGAKMMAELADEGVVASIGPLRSIVVEAAAHEAHRAGLALVTLAPGDELPYLGENVFRMGLTATDQVRALIDYAIGRKHFKRFAILYPQDSYGRAFKDIFWTHVEERGGTVVGVEGYRPDIVDHQAEVKKLVGLHFLTKREKELIRERDRLRRRSQENRNRLAAPALASLPPYVDFDALFIPDSAVNIGLILPQLRFYDVQHVTFLGSNGWNDSQLVEIAGRDARGAIFVDAFFKGSEKPLVQDFVTRYITAYGEEPDLLAAQGYDAAMLLRRQIEKSARVSRGSLRRELLEVKGFPGVSGLASFDETGGTRENLYLLTVQKNEIQQVLTTP